MCENWRYSNSREQELKAQYLKNQYVLFKFRTETLINTCVKQTLRKGVPRTVLFNCVSFFYFCFKNMIANLTGMICDGAKPSCALKISSGVSTALLSALLSMEGKCVTSAEGIVDDDVDKCIHNLTSIGADAMKTTDDMVLDIMTHK